MTTDEYPAYAAAIAAVYGEPTPAGEPAPETPRLPDWLVYATVHKMRENNRVVRVEARLVFGTLVSLAAALVWAGVGAVSTRSSSSGPTARTGTATAARCGRRIGSRRTGRCMGRMTYFTLYSANFCWSVRTLREEVIPNKRYRQRTPAMAAGLTDHVWTLEEWLLFPTTKRYQLPPFRKP